MTPRQELLLAEEARLKHAIAKNERRIKAGKPVPGDSTHSTSLWAVKRDLLVQRLERLWSE